MRKPITLILMAVFLTACFDESPPPPNTESGSAAVSEKENPAPPIVIADSSEVEQKIAEYINTYRSTKATVLSGLTQVARYRSQELVSNFAHIDW